MLHIGKLAELEFNTKNLWIQDEYLKKTKDSSINLTLKLSFGHSAFNY